MADNSPGRRPERIARGDQRDPTITELEGESAPSGLVAVSGTRLLMCGFVSRTLQPFVIEANMTASPDGGPVADDCALGVAALTDGRIVYSNEEELRVLRLD